LPKIQRIDGAAFLYSRAVGPASPLNVNMIYFRLGLCAATLGFSSCSLSTAPEPPEFKLSAESLSKQYADSLTTDAGRLYAGKILTKRDDEGRKFYIASDGALLMTTSKPPILALAPSILITPEFAEAKGKATVKKKGRLYIGEDDSTKIRIQGTDIKPEGPHVIRGIKADQLDPPAGPESAEAVDISLALTPSFAAAPPPAPLPEAVSEPVPVKPKSAVKAKAKARPAAAKPSSPRAAAQAKEAPAVAPAPTVDRSRLLNLMRAPTDR
jgi:hypothetical protein